jgi:hypothetical protein
MIILVIAGIVLVIYCVYQYSSPSANRLSGAIPVSNVISHWNKFFPCFSLSSTMFYTALENTLQGFKIPNAVISRTNRKEGGVFSSSREYLRIKHGDIVFEVCAAPFGNSFFISWWLYETEGSMRRLMKGTKMGGFLQARAARRTFYQIDEEEMFTKFVHECILETVDSVSEGKGFSQLTAAERMFKMGAA